MVLGHWALAMSQELPAWPCPVPSTLGTSITLSSSSRGRQCPERRGHQPKGRTTRKWPGGGWNVGFSELCLEPCLPRGALGAWQRPEKPTGWREALGPSGQLKAGIPKLSETPRLLCFPHLPTLAFVCVSCSVTWYSL